MQAEMISSTTTSRIYAFSKRAPLHSTPPSLGVAQKTVTMTTFFSHSEQHGRIWSNNGGKINMKPHNSWTI